GDNVGTPQQYSQQAGQIASSGNAAPQQDSSWQPLGVFAMAQGAQGDQQAQPTDVFQLAINAQGLLRGNHHHLRDNSLTPLTGAVDPKSQRAAWVLGDQQAPIYEAGIANLTQDQTTMLIHGQDGAVQQATLVRLPPPPQQAGGGPGGGPGGAPGNARPV